MTTVISVNPVPEYFYVVLEIIFNVKINYMKHLNSKTLLIVLLIISGYGYFISCTRNDSLIVPLQLNPPFTPSRGNNIHLPGNMTAGNTSEWKLDKVHSSVLWSTTYVGAAGLLTGRFNQFGMHNVTTEKMLAYATTSQPLKDTSWAFYENDPSKTYFNGYVQINTSNTGEPGRDAGCNVAGMNTVAIRTGIQNLSDTNLAKIKTTKVEFDPSSNGYIVTLDLTWHNKYSSTVALTPITKSIVGKLYYVTRKTVTPATGTPYDVFGLQLKFSFNCRDFGITSTSIADNIDIECNMNFNNK
jgi:polyisoprenoid-binding protein YceI